MKKGVVKYFLPVMLAFLLLLSIAGLVPATTGVFGIVALADNGDGSATDPGG